MSDQDETVTLAMKVAEVGSKRGKHFVTLQGTRDEIAAIARAGLLYAPVYMTLSKRDGDEP